MSQEIVRGVSPARQAWRRFRHKKVAMVSLAFILIVYTAGIFAPLVAPYSFREQNLDEANLGPGLKHFLGTDRLGRDIFSRIIYGARTAAIVSVAAVSLATLLGVVLGVVAGYLGRWVDTLLMRISDIFLAFPGLLLVIFIAATIRPRVVEWARGFEAATGIKGLVSSGLVDYAIIFGALSFFAWPGMARLVRSQVLSLKELQFIEAARSLGASTPSILFRHLLPNALSPILVSVTLGLGSAVTSEVVLSWLGVGVQPPNPSWGVMLWENQGMLRAHPHLLLIPAAVVGAVMFAFNLLGDGLNDALNPRTR